MSNLWRLVIIDKNTFSNKVKAKAYELGYDLCGIIKAEPMYEYVAYLDDRIKHYPESRHLYEDLYDLAYPQEKANWAKSIIVCVRRYSKYIIPQEMDKYIGKLYLFDRRLEYSKEYSDDNMFELFLKDMGMLTYKNGVAARWAAVKAELGTFGKNNFLYTKFGSWVSIDTWIVNKEMEYDTKQEKINTCGPNCRRCIDACPTKALAEPFMMNMGKCIAELSYFSTELYSTELIPENLREKMGTWIYGCDICQNVCPRNKNKWDANENFPQLDQLNEFVKLENILQMDQDKFLRIIQPRFWYVEKDSLWIWRCNALQAMVNSNNEKYHKYIKEACTDENKNVREMAAWACNKLDL